MAKAKKKKAVKKKAPARPRGVPKCAPKDDKSFYFMDIVNVITYAGQKAGSLRELRDGIKEASTDCLFQHTGQYFLKGNVQEHTNDFAHWVYTSLEESALAEQLSSIDPYTFNSMNSLRKAFTDTIDNYLENFPEPRVALEGEEFFFNESVSFIFPAGVKARNLAEFLMAIKHVDSSSIYYHFFESRGRLTRGRDDFSKWVDEVAKSPKIAGRLMSIDPFMNNLEHVRESIIRVLEEGIREEMEEME